MSEVKFNPVEDVIHVNAEVLSSYKSKSYRTDIVPKKTSCEVLSGKCKCVAGQGGKCNHVAGVLFGLFDFRQTVKDAPESCTSKEQKWHQPCRKAKKMTKALKIGKHLAPSKRYVFQVTLLFLPILKTECIEIKISVSDGHFDTYVVSIFSSNFRIRRKKN